MAKNKNMWPVIGAWAFIVGMVIAVLAGILGGATQEISLLLGVLGLIVGVINVSEDEVQKFLIATIAFTVAASSLSGVFASLAGKLGTGGGVAAAIAAILGNVVVFVAPAAGVVALKALYDITRSA